MRRCLLGFELDNMDYRAFKWWLQDYASEEILNYSKAPAQNQHKRLLFHWTAAEMTLPYLHAEISVSKLKRQCDHRWQETQ